MIKTILPLSIQSCTNNTSGGIPSSSLVGLGNAPMGLKYKLYDEGIVLASGLQADFATASTSKKNGLRTGYEANTFLPYLSKGKGFDKWYIFQEAGFGAITNGYSSYLKFNTEFGRAFKNKKLWVMAVLDFKISLKNGNFSNYDNVNYYYTMSYVDNQSFFGLGAKAAYEIRKDKFGINVAVIGAMYAEFAGGAPSINFSIYKKY